MLRNRVRVSGYLVLFETWRAVRLTECESLAQPVEGEA